MSKYACKMERSSGGSTSPNEKSQEREENPESRVSQGLELQAEQVLAHTLEQLELCVHANEELLGEIQQNQITIVGVFEALLSATQMFNSFSENLYRESQSLLLYRSFRSLYESFANCSSRLHKITSRDEHFNCAKAQYLSEQTRLLGAVGKRDDEAQVDERILKMVRENARLREQLVRYEAEPRPIHTETEIQTRQRQWLKERVKELELELEKNNIEFAEQIKMYNEVLQDKDDEIKKYRVELSEGMLTPRHLKSELVRCKQQIQKDQQLIETLTRKVRLLQRQQIFKDPVIQRSKLLTRTGPFHSQWKPDINN